MESDRTAMHRIHPVHRRDIEFATKASQRVFDELRAAAQCRIAGLTLVARARIGLSTALRLAATGLSVSEPTLPVCLIVGGRQKRTSDSPFWTSIVSQLAPTLLVTRVAHDLKSRLVENLITRALEVSDDRVLLIVDRAHDLEAHELSLLSQLQDSLVSGGIRLTVCLGGYVSLLARRDELRSLGLDEPYRRFFDRTPQVRGVCGAEELAFFLDSFDTTHYPLEGGPTYTQFYYPAAYARGWRLHSEAPRLWSAFHNLLVPYAKEVEVEMAYVTQAVCSVLDAAFVQGANALTPGDDVWLAAAGKTEVLSARMVEAELKSKAGGKK